MRCVQTNRLADLPSLCLATPRRQVMWTIHQRRSCGTETVTTPLVLSCDAFVHVTPIE